MEMEMVVVVAASLAVMPLKSTRCQLSAALENVPLTQLHQQAGTHAY